MKYSNYYILCAIVLSVSAVGVAYAAELVWVPVAGTKGRYVTRHEYQRMLDAQDRQQNLEKRAAVAHINSGDTPLHAAVYVGRFKGHSSLEDVNTANNEGKTPVHIAAAMFTPGNDVSLRTHMLATLLAQEGVNVNARDRQLETPLHCAAEHTSTVPVKMLLDAGADLNKKNNEDETPLHIASRNGNVAVVKMLLKRGALVDERTAHGNTPLNLAVFGRHMDVCKALVTYGANIDAPDEEGITPRQREPKMFKKSWYSSLAERMPWRTTRKAADKKTPAN